MTDHLEYVRLLQKRVEEEASKLGLKVGEFVLRPGQGEDGRDIASIVFVLTPEAVETAEQTEQRKVDDAFEALMGGAFKNSTDFVDDETKEILDKEAEKQAKAKNALEDLLNDFEDD